MEQLTEKLKSLEGKVVSHIGYYPYDATFEITIDGQTVSVHSDREDSGIEVNVW